MIKTFVFFIKNRNQSFDLSRLTRSHSRTICLRIWIDSSNCDVMFFSCSSSSWSHYSFTSFCRESLSYCFSTRFIAKSMKIREKCLISNAHFFFWSFFISKKRISSSWSKSWTMLSTNWWWIETRWKRFTIHSRNIIVFEFVERVLFSAFFFRRILHFDDHAMCLRFLHVLHILYFSMINESHSLMWCFMTHFSHTTTIRQCFFMCSYFWQLKHCRKVQFLINRSHFLISKIFIRFSKSIRLIISTMIIFICSVK